MFLTAGCRRPFWDRRLDKLDCLFSASLMLHLVASLYYADPGFAEGGGPSWRLEVSLIVINLGVLAAAVCLSLMSLLEDRFKAAAVAGLSKSIAALIMSLQLEMRSKSQSLLDALEEIKKAVPALVEGCRVSHPVRGGGVLTAVVPDDARGKLYHVDFDNGEIHHYSAESATKLHVDKDRGGAPADAVLLEEFQLMAQQCLQGSVHVSPAALEALFLALNALDAGQGAIACAPHAWVSVSMVPSPSAVCGASASVR
jgi:hypothetical protein